MVIAVYPGSFDPITNGHLDILSNAKDLFDKIIIAIAVNRNKKPCIDLNVRMELIKESIKKMENVEVDSFEGLTVNYAQHRKAKAIIRGLRAVSDYELEIQMAHMNSNLCFAIKTVFFTSNTEYAFLSSTVVKDVARLGGDISRFVPKNVNEYLMKLYERG